MHTEEEKPFVHFYVSTACQHSKHDLCRRLCKYCATSCRCRCHS